ncbi:MAG: NADH-quinone oxidoreductase subunit N [Bacteroidota bacterium]
MLAELSFTGPLVLIVATGLLTLLVDAFIRNSLTYQWWIAVIGLIAAGLSGWLSVPSPGVAFGGMLMTGGAAGYWAMVFSLAGLLATALSKEYLEKHGLAHGEYYALVLFGTAGMILMGAAGDLIVFFLGLELMSICFYVLAGFARGQKSSNEAALKYLLLGSFATGFLLYGIALIYGTTGTTNIREIIADAPTHAGNPIFSIGFALILIGLSFKVAAVPFHMWVPDVYEGAPTTISAFMSTGGKAAAFSVFLLIFSPTLLTILQPVRDVLAIVSALSMIVGNVLAIAQPSVKRMLAYSSIAHAGYILSGIVGANATGSDGVLFYLFAYTLMNAGAFGILALEESEKGEYLTFEEYRGFGSRKPFQAFLMALFMFSLAGVPPFAGFFGKYYVFAGAVQGGYTWLAIIGVVMSVVSVYYYLRLVVMMYFAEGSTVRPATTPLTGIIALTAAACALIAFGVYPSAILNVTRSFF